MFIHDEVLHCMWGVYWEYGGEKERERDQTIQANKQ